MHSTVIENNSFGKGAHSHAKLDSSITTHLVLISLEDRVVG